MSREKKHIAKSWSVLVSLSLSLLLASCGKTSKDEKTEQDAKVISLFDETGLSCLRYGYGIINNASGKYGIVDKYGKLLVPYEYEGIHTIEEDRFSGILAAKKNGKWGMIDISGNVIAPFEYEEIGYSTEGMIYARKLISPDDYKEGYLNRSGEIAVPFKYDATFGFSEGLAVVVDDILWIPEDNGKRKHLSYEKCKFGAVDKTGREVIPIKYNYLLSFREGLAAVNIGGRVPEAGLIIPAVRGKWGYIDANNKIVIPLEYDMAESFSEGFGAVMKNKKWGFVDRTGKVVIPFIYDDIRSFKEGLAGVKKDGKWGFIDKLGKVVIPIEYESLRDFDQSLAVVEKNGKYGIIDKNNRIVVAFEYDSIGDWSEGLIAASKQEKYGYIDRKGDIAIPLRYDSAEQFINGYAKVGQKEVGIRWLIPKVIDKSGKEVTFEKRITSKEER